MFARLLSPLSNRASALSTQLDCGHPSALNGAARSLGMGMLLGFVWTPCSGPLLAVIGLTVVLGADKALESVLIRLLPASWLSLTTLL